MTIIWPTSVGAETYIITITKDNETICALTLDSTGKLINVDFSATFSNDNVHHAPAALHAQSAFGVTVTGLECNTQYDYSIVAKGSNDQSLNTYNGTFRTTTSIVTDISINEYSDNAAMHTRKVFHNGQVLIQHNGKTYTATGNRVK